MAELISGRGAEVRSDGPHARHPITAGVPGALPLVYADLSMIERVVTNLLDNAMRHTPNGGKIRLAARQQDEQLRLKWRTAGPACRMRCGRRCSSGLRRWTRPVAGESRRVRADDCETDAGLHGGDIRLVDA
jgi:hypothetical protein